MAWTPERVSAQGPVEYNDSPPWDGGANCTGGHTPGARELGRFLEERYPFIYSVGGYSCRPSTGTNSLTSVHGLGRAIDLMIRPMPDGSADRRGDEVAQWLIDHAHELGVQLIIWDSTLWTTSRNGTGSFRSYTGQSAHRDHLHVEVNEAAANMRLPWYQQPEAMLAGSTASLVGDGGMSQAAFAVIAATATVGTLVAIYYGARWITDRSRRLGEA